MCVFSRHLSFWFLLFVVGEGDRIETNLEIYTKVIYIYLRRYLDTQVASLPRYLCVH